MNSVESFYDNNTQSEWERFVRHPTEFAVTKRALAEFLPPPPARILDCGGGPGRYALHLAQQGYEITLLDLSSANLAFARQKAQENQTQITAYVHGNALNLSAFKDASFDAVLLLGPLYHLLKAQDRDQAVCEALRVLVPGKPLFAGFITIYAPLRDAIAKGYLKDYSDKPELARQTLEIQTTKPDPSFTDAWFARPADISPWMESLGLQTRVLLATEGLTAGHEQHMNVLDPNAFEFWADLNYRLAHDPCLWGTADHLLYIGSKAQ